MLLQNSSVIRCPHLEPGDQVQVIDLGVGGERPGPNATARTGSRTGDIFATLKTMGLRPQLEFGSISGQKPGASEGAAAIERAFLDPEIRAAFVFGELSAPDSAPPILNYAALAAHPTILVTELAASPIATAVHLGTDIVTFCWLPPESTGVTSTQASSDAKGYGNGNGTAHRKGSVKPSHLDLLMKPRPVGRLRPQRVQDEDGNSRRQRWRWHNSKIGEGRLLIGGLESFDLLGHERIRNGGAEYLFLNASLSRVDSESVGSPANRSLPRDVMQSLRGMVLAELQDLHDRDNGEHGGSNESNPLSDDFWRSLTVGKFPIASGASILNGPGGSILPIGVRAQMNGSTHRLSIVEAGVV